MRKKLVVSAVAAVALTSVAGLGVARAQHGPGGGGWHHDSLFDGVTLTDAQQSQVAALHKASREADKPLFQQVHAIDEKIDASLLSSGTVTEATLAPLLQQKEVLMQKLETSRLTQQVAMRNLLTDAQLSAASTAHEKLQALHEQERALRSAGSTDAASAPAN